MSRSTILNWSLEFDLAAARRRAFGILPGALSWLTLIGLTILAFLVPFWIAVFIIVFDVYVLVRAVYMSIHLVYAYRRLRKMKDIDWVAQCKRASPDLSWEKINHIVVVPTYNESLAVLRTTLQALAQVDFPLSRLHIVVGFEERAQPEARERAARLSQEFGTTFGTLLTTFHPDNLPGEKPVKSANANWAVKKAEARLVQQGIGIDHILVSNFDSDTVVSPDYFAYLTYAFITHPDRYHVSYQPLPLYNNNVWDAPAFSRVIATGSTFWQMIESTRPDRLVTFSSHSMTLVALKDVGYWQRNIISEDSRIFWQCLLKYNGKYRTVPLYITVSMDAALAPSWWKTLMNQNKQKRRWAWGIENFPYLMEGFLKNRQIPWRIKWTYTWRTLEGHYSWATSAIIVAVLGWLPVFFGNESFHQTFLSYSLPFMTRTLMTIAMTGLIVSAVLTILLLPHRPKHHGPWRYALIVLQWVLVPLIATVLSAFPALDSETRLMLGRDLNFNVMQKTRKRLTSKGLEAV